MAKWLEFEPTCSTAEENRAQAVAFGFKVGDIVRHHVKRELRGVITGVADVGDGRVDVKWDDGEKRGCTFAHEVQVLQQ